MHIYRSKSEPNRKNPSWEERWGQVDKGLIMCWERGREKAEEDPQLAICAKARELMPLPWKGGVNSPKPKHKYGTLFYLAMWQGLRGEDLNIYTDRDLQLTCAKTRVAVTFTDNNELLYNILK